MSREIRDHRYDASRNGRLPIVVLLVASLLAAGGLRMLAGDRRRAIEPELNRTALEGRSEVTLGQLNSFTLALLLGGLRGPLVMALWSSSDRQKMEHEYDDLDTKIELIRLLQPQFDSVHLYQIWNKAYNLSGERANLASRYAIILDAIDYAEKVIAERPNNIDLETQLGEVYANKLGGAQESDYFTRRVLQETQASEPAVKITFDAGLEEALRRAALIEGMSAQLLSIQRADQPSQRVTVVDASIAEAIRPRLPEDGFEFETMAPREVNARGVGGPLRLEPMLAPDGSILPELIEPRTPVGEENGIATGLDGSQLQFLKPYAPFPEGISAHALAYNRFMRAYVLQEYAGQRHIQNSERFIEANPGRALTSWALAAYVEGRMLEAEAFGHTPAHPGIDGELQAALERVTAGIGLDADPLSPALLAQAVQRYERSLQVGADAIAWLQDHLDQYPAAASTFAATVTRLQDQQVLLRADVIYARLIQGAVPDRPQAIDQATALYTEAQERFIDFILRYYTPRQMLPPGVTASDLLSQPRPVKLRILDILRAERDRSPGTFDHTRVLNEFDGYFARISARLAELSEAQDQAPGSRT